MDASGRIYVGVDVAADVERLSVFVSDTANELRIQEGDVRAEIDEIFRYPNPRPRSPVTGADVVARLRERQQRDREALDRGR